MFSNSKQIDILEEIISDNQLSFYEIKKLIDPNHEYVKIKAILDYNVLVNNPKAIAISRKMHLIYSFYRIVDSPKLNNFLGSFDKYYNTTVIVDDSLSDFEVKIIN